MNNQRKNFIESLKIDISKYKSNILSAETSKAKFDAKEIEKDWKKVISFNENEK